MQETSILKIYRYTILSILTAFLLSGCDLFKQDEDLGTPHVGITNPTNNDIVQDMVVIACDPGNSKGVQSVSLFLDDSLLVMLDESPFVYEWDTWSAGNGDHDLFGKIINKDEDFSFSDTITVTVQNYLFIANFTQDWLPENAGEGFIVISDISGAALASATWSGNSRIEFSPPPDMNEKPSRIIVTIGTRDPYYNTVYMTSNCYVKPGEWTWKGKPQFEYQGSATLQFTNDPGGSGWCLVSGQNRFQIMNLPPQDISFPLYNAEDDLYFMMSPDEGQSYLWIEDIVPGEIRSVDLANLSGIFNSSDFTFPLSSHFFFHVLGYHIPGEYYNRYFYLLDHEMFGEEAMSSFSVTYPVEISDVRTQFVIFDSPDHWNGDYWSFYHYGDVPTNYEQINADFTIVNSQPDSFQIDITGTTDNVLSNWVGYSGWNQVRWRVFTNPNYTAFALPRMPDSIAISYDLPYSIQFSLEDVEIMDYPDLDNHEEVIETLFQSDDYFFNIATDGVLIRTKQNNSFARSIIDDANTSNSLKQYDPMIPIP